MKISVNMSQKIEGHTISHLCTVATDREKKATAGAKILDKDAEHAIPKFKASELTDGRVLGKGGFCVVNEITKITLAGGVGSSGPKEDDEHHIYNIIQDRGFMAQHCIRSGKDCRYAVKILKPESYKDAPTFVSALTDLAMEARFLSVIRHPHIIKMRAMAASPQPTKDPGFFIVLDRLYDILSQRLVTWKKRAAQGKGFKKALLDSSGKKKKEFWAERMHYVYDLSLALVFMHEHSIIYRDLKPDNVGFDVRGDIKIFDLGLAKELHKEKMKSDGTYNLTENTGSPRYMAPEVALGKPYNLTADVHSFSILAYEMLSASTPFEGYTFSMLTKRVVEGGIRPKCSEKWSPGVVNALKKGWSPAATRSSMSQISDDFQEEINKLSMGEGMRRALVDASAKSEHSLRNLKRSSGPPSKPFSNPPSAPFSNHGSVAV